MKKAIFLAILALILIIPLIPSSVSAVSPSYYCPILDLHVGSTDASTNGNVSALQEILIGRGFLTLPFGVTTGYFGNLTRGALASLQASLGIYPPVGYFGPLTRAKLQSIYCSPVPRPVPPPAINGPVISGVSAPTTLGVGETGTWRVSASDPQNGNLSYSVDWGDRKNGCTDRYSACAQLADEGIAAFQQSTSFTHSYSQAGTYTQIFTVRNDRGQEAQTSTTVQVTDNVSNGAVSLNRLSPSSGSTGTDVTIFGSGFTSTNNTIIFGGNNIGTANMSNGTLSFEVPDSVGPPPCDGRVCQERPTMLIQPGTYSVLVQNSNGTSNSLNFTVTGGMTSQPTY